MDWSSLLSQIGQNLKDKDQTGQDATAAMTDRIKMAANPQLQGPQVGWNNSLPAEQQQAKDAVSMVAGATNPVASEESSMGSLAQQGMQKMAPQTAAEVMAQKGASQALEGGAAMPAVARSQQALSRAADFADRARMQRFQSLRNKLGG